MKKYLLDYDPALGTHSEFIFDEMDNQYHINEVQDVTAIIEANKIARNLPQKTGDGIGQRIASIPMSIYMELRAKGIAQDEKALSRWLNDSDNQVFKTSDRRL